MEIRITSPSGSYNPITITGNNSSSDNFAVTLADSVAFSGTIGTKVTTNVVGKTWNITASTAGTCTIKLYWNASDELPGFDRNNCFVSHYTGGKWVSGAVQSAIKENGLYAISQADIPAFPHSLYQAVIRSFLLQYSGFQ